MKKIVRKVKFEEPKEITQQKDAYGCTGFISYGFVEYDDHTYAHVKNPDFDWKR